MKRNIPDLSIFKDATVRDALKKMDIVGRKLLIVVDNNGKFYSLVSIGDIQRSIIGDKDLNTPIEYILRPEIRVANENDNLEQIKKRMIERRNEFMPVISTDGEIVEIILWEDLFEEKLPKSKKICNLPIVIMAGGKGKRLRPLTNVLPKPLVPIGDKTVIEIIMDRFLELGSKRFFISLNYKADLIEYYFKKLNNQNYSIEYIREPSPLGTAGSLHFLIDKINETFFITNCDILIDQDYSEILDYHKENRNEITIVSALKNLPLPYGVLETGKNSILKEIDEKPELTIKINTGFYILEPHLINEIPKDTIFNLTQLIEKVIKRRGSVGVFPISEKSWTDIGNWNEYLTFIER